MKMRGQLDTEDTDRLKLFKVLTLEHCSWSIDIGGFGITDQWRGFKGHSD